MKHAPIARDAPHADTRAPDDAWLADAKLGVLPLEDLSELEPPEPLERVLLACARLDAEAIYSARMPRFPTMLFPQLEARGLDWRVAPQPDGTAILWIRGRKA